MGESRVMWATCITCPMNFPSLKENRKALLRATQIVRGIPGGALAAVLYSHWPSALMNAECSLFVGLWSLDNDWAIKSTSDAGTEGLTLLGRYLNVTSNQGKRYVPCN